MPGGSQNAVTGRNRSVLVSFRLSHRPLRSELQPARTRKPFQPVKLLSLPCGTDLLSPSLRLGVFRFITVCILPHFAEVCKGLYHFRPNRISHIRRSSFYFSSQHPDDILLRPLSQAHHPFSGWNLPAGMSASLRSPPFQEVSDKFCHHTDSARSAYNRGKLHPRKNGSYPPSLP